MNEFLLKTILFRLASRPTLVAAFNAAKLVADDDFFENLEVFKKEFDASPYEMGKRLGVLRNNSAEDFAVEWMGFYNATSYMGGGY